MINKRFLNFKTYAEFSRLNEAGEIRPESIVWIADTNQMWTHGTLYSSITEEQARKLAGILTDGAGLKYLTDKLTYEELPDQATVIDIDGKIMDLTTESNNEDILAVFGTLPDFTSLIETVRNSETILNSILVDNDSQVGKVNATILANKASNILDVIYFDHVKKTFVQLTITETEGILSCVREEFGSAGGGDATPEVAITEAEPVPGSQEKVYYQVVEDNVDLGVDTDAPADGNIYGRKDNAWQKIEATSQPDLSNYLAKDNTTSYIPTENYHPATKRYVDRRVQSLQMDIKELLSEEGKSFDFNYDFNGNSGTITNVNAVTTFLITDYDSLDSKEKGSFTQVTPEKGTFTDGGIIVKLYSGNVIYISYTGKFGENYITMTYKAKYIQRILTESEYSALGDTPNTDGVLYFVTPDA